MSDRETNSNKAPVEFFAKFLKAKVDKRREYPELLEIVKRMDLDQDGYLDENDI
jgi:hypothetical protein